MSTRPSATVPDADRCGDRGCSDRARDQSPDLDAREPCLPAASRRGRPRPDRHRSRLYGRATASAQSARRSRRSLADWWSRRRADTAGAAPRGAPRADRAEPREPHGPTRSISTTCTASTRRPLSRRASARSRSTATRAGSRRSGSPPSTRADRGRPKGRRRSRRFRTTTTSPSEARTTSSTTARRTGWFSFRTTRSRGASPGSLGAIAESHNASPEQIALAWLLRRSPVVLPIPGTLSIEHLRENLGALEIELTDDEFEALA